MNIATPTKDITGGVAFEPDPAEPLRFLRACPAYEPTPVREIGIAGGAKIAIKDETNRMGLGAFKALGGVYAVARLIMDRCEAVMGRMPRPDEMLGPEVGEVAGLMTFVCASAGNHGMAVAEGARIFGASARIYLAETVPQGFEMRLKAREAEVVRHGKTYEESVEAAISDARETGAILLADGSWPGYVGPPSLVMEGYTVLAEELRQDFERKGQWPTHVYLQAGVGGLAGAIAHMIRNNWSVQPVICVVEPDRAACLAASHKAGRPAHVTGAESNMGRLDCKEPSIVAFAALENACVEYMEVSDEEAAGAARALEGHGITTTPSGAAGYAAILASGLLQASASSYRPLAIVTEGAV